MAEQGDGVAEQGDPAAEQGEEQGDRAAGEQGDRAAEQGEEQGDRAAGEQGDGVAFVVGEKFSSYDELKAKVSTYEKSRCVQLFRSDSRTLDAARKRVPRKVESARKDLVYYRINLSCVFGGKKYQSKGGGKRPHQSTIKQDCKAGVKLSLSDDGQHLVVNEVNEEHNHDVCKAIYDHLPRQRQLSAEDRKEAEGLLKMKVNKKLLQQHLSGSTGKVVTLKDITNIQTGLSKPDDSNLESVVNSLRKIEGSTVDVFTNAEGTFTGLFFQDNLMKSVFSSYPEVLLVDATYKLIDLRMPVYLMMCIDGNGQGEIVLVFITSVETEESITKMVQAFKAINPQWSETKVVMSDKDFTERTVFRKEFPRAALHICLFHTLRSFRREVTTEKLGIRPGERDHALEIITKLAYSKSESEYEEHYQDLLQSGLKTVISYYNSNWHNIRHEWVECFKGVCFTLGERTNNRLENINGKIKSVCSRNSSLSKFFDQFFAVLSSLRNERDHATLMALVKRKVDVTDPVEIEYASLLTPYALGFVSKQLALRCKVRIIHESPTDCQVSSSEGILKVTTEMCQCAFWNNTHLPCRHMLAIREKKQLPLFANGLVAQRWTLDHMKTVYDHKTSDINPESFQLTTIGTEHARTVLTQHQKFHKAEQVTQQLAALASEVGMDEFQQRLAQMRLLRDTWAKGGTITLKTSGVDTHDASTSMESSLDSSSTNNPSIHTSDQETGNGERNSPPAHVVLDGIAQKPSQKPQPDVSKILLPPVMRKRGRPKGADKTVIGLPKKKYRGDKPIPFIKKSPKDKEKAILSWFVDSAVAASAIDGEVIEESEVEVRPEKVSASCLDENVCIESCRKYCTRDAWMVIEGVVESLRKNPMWYCGRCTNPISDDIQSSVVCDCCLNWYHFTCLNLKQPPKSKVWFCRSCYDEHAP